MDTIKYIYYTAGYKYQLEVDYQVDTGIVPATPGGNRFVQITLDGNLLIRAGYPWDGPSGPTLDTPDFMRGSLVRDALYQLMRENFLSKDLHRKQADSLLRAICREDGMPALRAWYVYLAVRNFGGHYMRNVSNKVLTAPEQKDDKQ